MGTAITNFFVAKAEIERKNNFLPNKNSLNNFNYSDGDRPFAANNKIFIFIDILFDQIYLRKYFLTTSQTNNRTLIIII